MERAPSCAKSPPGGDTHTNTQQTDRQTGKQSWNTICGQLWSRQLFNARLGIFMNATQSETRGPKQDSPL